MKLPEKWNGLDPVSRLECLAHGELSELGGGIITVITMIMMMMADYEELLWIKIF